MRDQAPSYPSKQAGKTAVIVTLLIVIALAIATLWYLAKDTEPAPAPIEKPVDLAPPPAEVTETEIDPPVTEPADTVELEETAATPEPEPVAPAKPLPKLAESNDEILQRLSEAEQPIEPLRSEQLIRDAVVFVDNLRNGVVVKEAAIIEGPKSRFRVLEQDGKIYIDPRSYDRYNTIVDWFVSLDNAVLIQLMNEYQPLLKEALAEIGYPDTAPKTVLFEAIEVLQATPSVGTVIELTDESVMYRYADPALEALPAAQKQMLRLGPDNMRRIKDKLESLHNAMLTN